MNKAIFSVVAVAAVCVVAGVLLVRRGTPKPAAPAEEAPVHLAVMDVPPPADEVAPKETPPEKRATVAVPTGKPEEPAVEPAPAPRKPKAPLQDPKAREALRLVGVDPEADQYWTAAINDPSISEHERKDLIEDLNEEGFPNPKNLTPDDLPLIQNRIALIQQHGPNAMDQANAAAFREALKDLQNMYLRVVQLP